MTVERFDFENAYRSELQLLLGALVEVARDRALTTNHFLLAIADVLQARQLRQSKRAPEKYAAGHTCPRQKFNLLFKEPNSDLAFCVSCCGPVN